MQLALEQAARGEGRTAPNPPVGALIVKNGEIVGRGYHAAAGQPHAEVNAIRDAAGAASGSTLYVTLEPCNHTGRTGPCTEAVIAAGISRVVVGCVDPNPSVAGSGVERLQQAGIDVQTGLLEKECKRLIAPFAKHISTGLPFVTLKMAMTLDGQTATSTGDSQWISNEQSRRYVHEMRDRSDAVMVGAGTVLTDDPLLTTRLPQGGRDATRVVIDSQLRMSVESKLLSGESTAPVIVFATEQAEPDKRKKLAAAGADVVITGADAQGRVDLNSVLTELGKRDIQSVLLEGGATLAGESVRTGIVDRVAIFVAPLLFGGNDGSFLFNGAGSRLLADATRLSDIRTRMFGDDILIEGEVA